MENIRNRIGIGKFLFTARLKIHVFFHYLKTTARGEIPPKALILLLRRLLFFLSKLRHNKAVAIGKNTRLDLYVPGFPSRAFYTACDKFGTFGAKLPNTTVLVSLTSACRYACVHCYQRNDRGKDLPVEKLLPVVRRLQDMGVAFFNIEGGEPFLVYDKLRAVCGAIDERSEIWINSTGDGMTFGRCSELKQNGVTAVMFSLHSAVPEVLERFMGFPGSWRILMKGIDACHKAGLAVAFNICLKAEAFYDGRFEAVIEKTKELGAAIVQLIKPKPAGAWLSGGAGDFTSEDLSRVKTLVKEYNNKRRYAGYPAISAQVMEEDPGMFGCTAGGTDRFYINAKGDVQPCEFLNISFGNIGTEDFDAIYHRMRAVFRTPGECWLCEKYAGEISRLMKQNNLRSLPLDAGLSKELYAAWDRGNPTGLYRVIEEELR
ncbi:MAG: radical SAM protein [Spirochaetales bacterium]|nr:radical SAM protein [Spirochaetales bacterium]